MVIGHLGASLYNITVCASRLSFKRAFYYEPSLGKTRGLLNFNTLECRVLLCSSNIIVVSIHYF